MGAFWNNICTAWKDLSTKWSAAAVPCQPIQVLVQGGGGTFDQIKKERFIHLICSNEDFKTGILSKQKKDVITTINNVKINVASPVSVNVKIEDVVKAIHPLL